MATSYANSGGTGNRLALITTQAIRTSSLTVISSGAIDNMVDGDLTTGTGGAVGLVNAATDYTFYFDFRPTGFSQKIDEITFKWAAAVAQGTFSLEAWNGAGWVTLHTGFTIGGAGANVVVGYTNTNSYLVYRLVQTSGSMSSAQRLVEVEFKIEQGAAIGAVGTSYANPGGTGNRAGLITMSGTLLFNSGSFATYINGVTSDAASNTIITTNQTGKTIQFDFGLGNEKVIDEFKYYTGNGSPQGPWVVQASQDSLVWNDVGTPFALTGAGSFAAVTFSVPMAGNVTSYRYYRFHQVSVGLTSASPQQGELEFKLLAQAPPAPPGSFSDQPVVIVVM